MVEWKKLGEVCSNMDSLRKPIKEDYRIKGPYPYYGASGIVDYIDSYIFDGDFLLVSEDGANLTARTSPIAFSIRGKNWVNNHAHVLAFENKITQKLVEVYLNSIDLSPWINGAAQPKLNQANLKTIPIPIPSLSEQSRIVSILDTFISSISNLKQQIEERRKQYEYERDLLLDLEGKEGVEMKVEDFCVLKAGKNIKADDISEENIESHYPCFGGNGIRGFVSFYSHDGQYPIIGRQGALCGCVAWATGKFYATEHAVVVTGKNMVCQRFLLHLFQYANLNQYKSQGAQPGLSVAKLNEIKFFIPPLSTQSRIVSILDTFEQSISNLEEQLAMREKQYEYYRNQLLTFEGEEERGKT